MAGRNKESALTLVELLVLIFISVVLLVMLLPAMWSARGPAIRISCRNNLKQIGLAFGMYQADFGDFFPTAASRTWANDSNGWGVTTHDLMGDAVHNPLVVLAHEHYLQIGWDNNSERVSDSMLACPSDARCKAPLPATDKANNRRCRSAHVLEGISTSYNVNHYLCANTNPAYRDFAQKMTKPGKTMLAIDWDWWSTPLEPAMSEGITISGTPTSLDSRDNACAALERHGGKGANVLYADLHVSFTPAFEWDTSRAFFCRKPDGAFRPAGSDAVYFYMPLGIPPQ